MVFVGKAYDVMSSYISYSKQSTFVNGVLSSYDCYADVIIGVPQGSVTGHMPFFFFHIY